MLVDGPEETEAIQGLCLLKLQQAEVMYERHGQHPPDIICSHVVEIESIHMYHYPPGVGPSPEVGSGLHCPQGPG